MVHAVAFSEAVRSSVAALAALERVTGVVEPWLCKLNLTEISLGRLLYVVEKWNMAFNNKHSSK
jgi:hypothetical protein